MAAFNAGTTPSVNLDFNDGLVPADGLVFGTAMIGGVGGVDNTAFMQLTEAVNSQGGSFIIPTPAGVAPIYDFTATWMMRVGGGTATPADGFAFCFGSDIADVVFGEDGAGSGLIVGFDTYDNGTVEVAPEITIIYKTVQIATRPFDISVLHTDDGLTPGFKQIGVRVSRTGVLDLFYGNTAVYRGLQLPNYTPFAAGRFAWGARTGGLNDNHWVDDIKIALNTQAATGPTIVVTRSGATITITWTGGGVLETSTTPTGGWSEVTGATSGYTAPTTDPARYYRVRQ
jgi:hypothetical protein